MKAAKGSLGRSLDRPDEAIRFYLFHGPDEAGSRALALRLLRGLGDAEKFIVLGQAVKGDPAALADEAGAMSLFGGRRAIWIEPAGDEIASGVDALLTSAASESAVIAIAGPLAKSSALLKLAESHPHALAHISYAPDAREFEQSVAAILSGHGLVARTDVVARVAASSALNAAVAAMEAEKFAAYLDADPGQPKPLSHEVIDLLGADSSEGEWLKIGDLALSGQNDALLDELGRLSAQAPEAVPIIRGMQRRLLQLAPLRARVERGERVDAVLTSLGKSLFWKDKPLMQRLLSTWTPPRLAEAMRRSSQLERHVMGSSAAPASALGEAMISISRAARARR